MWRNVQRKIGVETDDSLGRESTLSFVSLQHCHERKCNELLVGSVLGLPSGHNSNIISRVTCSRLSSRAEKTLLEHGCEISSTMKELDSLLDSRLVRSELSHRDYRVALVSYSNLYERRAATELTIKERDDGERGDVPLKLRCIMQIASSKIAMYSV